MESKGETLDMGIIKILQSLIRDWFNFIVKPNSSLSLTLPPPPPPPPPPRGPSERFSVNNGDGKSDHEKERGAGTDF